MLEIYTQEPRERDLADKEMLDLEEVNSGERFYFSYSCRGQSLANLRLFTTIM